MTSVGKRAAPGQVAAVDARIARDLALEGLAC
jgi:hypothetical protein